MTMLWLGLITTVHLLGLSFGAAYQPTPSPSSYAGSGQSYETVGNRPYTGSYSQNRYGSAGEDLDAVIKNVKTLEERQTAQLRRDSMLSDTTNDNLRFKIDFLDIFQKEITEEQYEQNSGLDGLAKKIAEIQKLRSQATEAWDKYVNLKTTVNNTQAADNKVLHTIQDLKQADDGDKEVIDDILARMDNFGRSFNPMFETIANNSQGILDVELVLKSVILHLNAQKGKVTEYHLTLDPNGSAYATNDYPGTPHENWIGATGNKFRLKKTYEDGDLAIHYIATATYYNDKVYIDVTDSSTANLGTSVARVDLLSVEII